MKRINWQVMGQLGISLLVIVLSIAVIFWLPSFGPVREASARLAQVNLYNDYVHHPTGNIQRISEFGGPTYAVDVQGSYAYIGTGHLFLILNIYDPYHPMQVGQISLPCLYDILDIVVAGNIAYVATLGCGLHIIDVSDPAFPTQVGFVNVPWGAKDISVAGAYVYIAAGAGGLRIVDVSHPATPAEVGYWQTHNNATGVAVAGNYAYVADWNGLYIINVSLPITPTQESFFPLTSPARVKVSGNYAYVTCYSGGLHIIDVSNPTSPSEAGYHSVMAYDVTVVGNYAYVTSGNGFYIINVSDPTHLYEVGFYGTPGGAYSVKVIEPYVYVADSAAGLRIISISSGGLTEIGFYETTSGGVYADGVVGVAVLGEYAYLADRGKGLIVISVRDPMHPVWTGFCSAPQYPWDVAVAGSYAYVADGAQGLRVIDISDPTNPAEVGHYDTPGEARHVVVAGNYAYVADRYGGLRIVNISNPTAPTEIGYAPGYAEDVAVAGKYAYITSYHRLHIINISNPSSPTEVTSYLTPESPFSVSVRGNHAYVGSYEQIYIFNVSNPVNPTLVGSYRMRGGAVVDITVIDTYLYAALGNYGLGVADISNPTHPVELGGYNTYGLPKGVTVAGGYAYIANGNKGIIILQALKESITALIPPTGGSLSLASGDIQIEFPSGAFTQTVNVTCSRPLHPPGPIVGPLAGLRGDDRSCDLRATFVETGRIAGVAPGMSYTITIYYSEVAARALIKATLAVYWWNGKEWKWEKEVTSRVYTPTNKIIANPTHLSLWTVLGETRVVYLPLILRNW